MDLGHPVFILYVGFTIVYTCVVIALKTVAVLGKHKASGLLITNILQSVCKS